MIMVMMKSSVAAEHLACLFAGLHSKEESAGPDQEEMGSRRFQLVCRMYLSMNQP